MNADLTAFVEGGVSILVAARSATFEPALARASACRVDRTRGKLRVLLSQRASTEVLDNLRQNGLVAVTFAQPSTHRSAQLKGNDARLIPADTADWDAVQLSRQRFREEVLPLGFSSEYVDAVLHVDAADAIVVEFTPTEAFNQTPGRNAGAHLDVRNTSR